MENKILIEPLINGKEHGFAVQAETFSFDLKITNMSNEPSPKFNITKIFFESAEGKRLSDDFSGNSFFIDVLNPKESKIVNIGKNGQFLSGLVTAGAFIAPQDSGVKIVFLQKNPCTQEICKINGENRWLDFFYMKSLSEYGQEKTNRWMMIFTCIIAFFTLVQLIILFVPFFLKK